MELAHDYRLQKINEIQTYIEKERDHRANISKKYRRGERVSSVIVGVSTILATGLSAAGVGVLSTIAAAPIGIGTITPGLVLYLISFISGRVNKKLALKREKHEKIKTLAEAKLNTISDLVSKALVDDEICEEEYSLILRELEKFNEMKEEITIKTKVKDQETFLLEK